jgi:hypothetical protein
VSPYSAAWIAWGAAFAVVEARALRDGKPGGTLSENLRTVLGTSRGSSGLHRALGSSALVLFAAWFLPHILIAP